MPIDKEQLADIYKQVQKDATQYQENEAYVKGRNPQIMHRSEHKEPDNRIPIPFAKLFVNTMTGYAGRNIHISYPTLDESDSDSETTDYQQRLMDFQDWNDDDLLLGELYKEILSQKEAYLLFWVSDGLELPEGMLTPEYTMIESRYGRMVYDNSIKPKPTAFIRYTVIGDDMMTADVYYPGFSEHWVSADNGSVWNRSPDGDTTYPYTQVPAIRFRMSKDGGPVFEAEKETINQIDKVVSRSSDELERFANVTLLLPNKTDKEFADNVRTAILTMMDDLENIDGDKWPRYLEKNLSGVSEYQQNLLTKLEDYMHETIGIPNMMNERFGSGDESGVARAFKLISMEYLASGIELYFFKGLYERKKMFDDVIRASNSSMAGDIDLHTTEIKAERDLPMDDAAKASIAQTLLGIVSKETIIKKILGKIVGDPEKELERIENEAANNPQLITPPVEDED